MRFTPYGKERIKQLGKPESNGREPKYLPWQMKQSPCPLWIAAAPGEYDDLESNYVSRVQLPAVTGVKEEAK